MKIKEGRPDVALLLFFIAVNVKNYIFDTAVEYFAKILYFLCRYSAALFHSVNCCAADAVLVYECVCAFTLFFNSPPERLIADHIITDLMVECIHIVDNSHNYDYNIFILEERGISICEYEYKQL